MENQKTDELLKTLHEIEDLDNVEKRARRVYHELLDFLQLVWRAQGEQHLTRDLARNTIELSFVEITTSDPTGTQCNLQLSQNFIQFRSWNAQEESEQGLSITLSTFQEMIDSQIVWPMIRFSPFGTARSRGADSGSIELEEREPKALVTFTHPEVIPRYFQKMIVESLEGNGFVYVPYLNLQRVMDMLSGVQPSDKSVSTWWQRYFL